jgi:hypothetical protein
MRRRDWLKSLAVLAAVPMIGVRKAVASSEAAPETLPTVAPPTPAAEMVTGPCRQCRFATILGGPFHGESAWVGGPPVFTLSSNFVIHYYRLFTPVALGGAPREAWVHCGEDGVEPTPEARRELNRWMAWTGPDCRMIVNDIKALCSEEKKR